MRATWVVLSPQNSQARGTDRHVHEYTKTPMENARERWVLGVWRTPSASENQGRFPGGGESGGPGS